MSGKVYQASVIRKEIFIGGTTKSISNLRGLRNGHILKLILSTNKCKMNMKSESNF